MMERISEHISFAEAIRSRAAIRHKIKNEPNDEQLANMKLVANVCFEPLRKWWGKPLVVSSFFRCPELNLIIGGSPTSDHPKGSAIDIDTGSRADNKKLFDWAKSNLKFDQLIYEYGDEIGPEWVHISFRKGMNRNQTLYKK